MEILIVTNMYPHKGRPQDGIFVKEQIDAIERQCKKCNFDIFHIRGYESALNYFKAIFKLRRVLREKKYDLIHAHYGLSGFVSIFQRGVPVICTFHGSDVLYIWWHSLISKIITIFLIHSIAVSSKIARKLPTDNISVIPCGVNFELFKPMSITKARKKLGLRLDKKYLLFPSAKDRKVKNYPLFKKVLERTKKILDVEEVVLEGYDRKQVSLVLNSVDVVLYTSFSEGSPQVMKEAMACNTPIVCAVDKFANKFFKNVKGFYYSRPDEENLSRIIMKILTQDKWGYDLRSKAKRYSNEKVAKQLLKLYQNFYYTSQNYKK